MTKQKPPTQEAGALLEEEMNLTFMKEELVQLREILDDIWDFEVLDGDGFERTPFSKYEKLAKEITKRIDRALLGGEDG